MLSRRMRRRWRWRWPILPTTALALALASVALLQGCPPKQQRDESATQPAISPRGAADPPGGSRTRGTGAQSPQPSHVWPFWPVRMRIHPLTRLARDDQTGAQIIECRIEFEDQDGHTSKATGQLTLQLFPEPDGGARLGGGGGAGAGALQTWNQDLRDLAVNRRQYDEVTRTYLFRLRTTEPLPVGCELRAFFLSADGRRLATEMRVRQ